MQTQAILVALAHVCQRRRSFIGVELDPEHFETSLRRIEEAYRQPRLFAEPEPKPVQSTISFEVSK